MDRERVIELAWNFNKNYIDMGKILNMIAEYCLEMGQSDNEVHKFINIVANRPDFPNIIDQCLKYYKNKFSICELYDLKANMCDITQKPLLIY